MNRKTSEITLYTNVKYEITHACTMDEMSGWVCICARKSLVFTKKGNLSMNCDNVDVLAIEIGNAKDQN